MTAEATVVIKGRNDLSAAVNQAERDLKKLVTQGELLGKIFRGGAIVGAVLAFERLAENAEKAAEAVGDKGTARSLRQLNAEIDNLKAKGLNLIGKVLGDFYTQARGSPFDKELSQIEYRVADLKKKLGGGLFGFVIWGPGGRAAAEQELKDLEARLKLFQNSMPYGLRTSAPGSQGGGSRGGPGLVGPPPKASAGGTTGFELSPIEISAKRMFDLAELQAQALSQIDADVSEQVRRDVIDMKTDTLEQVGQMTDGWKTHYDEISTFAQEAAKGMQDAFADFLFDPFAEGLKGMAKGFVDVIRRMVAELAAQQMLTAFFGWAGGAIGGSVGSFVSALAPGRASGGPVAAGMPYTIGERGKETFVPQTAGYVLPAGAGGGINIVNHIDARGADAERIMSMMPGLLKQSEDRTIARLKALQKAGRA